MPTPTNIEIKARFYEAFDKLVELGVIESKTGFCNARGLDRRNFQKVRDTPTCRIDPSLIASFVSDFGISAHWLLIGEGKMFDRKA